MLSWLGSGPAKPHHRKTTCIIVFVVSGVTASDNKVATRQSLVEETCKLTMRGTRIMSSRDLQNILFSCQPSLL